MLRYLETTTSDGGSTSEEEEEHTSDYISFGVLVLAMSIGIVTRTTIANWIPIPYTVLLLIWGGIFGAIYTTGEPFNPALNNSMESWLHMDPRVLQVVFLPILIFASAFNAEVHILERRLGQILFLALPGVIVGAVLTATFMKYLTPYDWSWELCLVFGSMVAATDPVAVVALLEELGVSEKLGTLIEGESLLNDGSAIVVFEVFLEAVEGESRTWYQVIEFGSRLALGGPAVGALIGILGSFILGYVINDPLVEVSLTIVLTYSTFALCEDTRVKVSGVLGIVALGVVLSYYGRPRVSSSVLPSLRDFWKTLQFFADTTIFFLSGLIVVGVAINDSRAINGRDWGYLVLLFIALYIIRGLVVMLAYPVLRSGEYKITIPQMVVLTHSGLRGAVALILALVVDDVPEEYIAQTDRDKILFHVAGVAVLSLLFNGTTTGPLVRFLKLDRASEASESVFGNACFALEVSMEKQQKALKEDPFLGDANWGLVWRYIPLFTADTYWHRLSKGHIVLCQDEVEDVVEANGFEHSGGAMTLKQRVRGAVKGGFSYWSLPHRLRAPWFTYNTTFLFNDAGGEPLWGNLQSFLANHAAGDEHGEAWTGHLKHSKAYRDMQGAIDDEIITTRTKLRARYSVSTPAGHDGPPPTSLLTDRMSPTASGAWGSAASKVSPVAKLVGAGGRCNRKSANDSGDVEPANDVEGAKRAAVARVAAAEARDQATARSAEGAEVLPVSPEDGIGSDSADSPVGGTPEMTGVGALGSAVERDDKIPKNKTRISFSRRAFQRAASLAKSAGMTVELQETGDDQELNQEDMIEARLRFLAATKAEYSKAKREGKLGSSGLRELTESIHIAHDKAEKGGCIDSWSALKGHFKPGMVSTVAKFLNWWPARPVAAAAIARRLSFQLELAWNFLEGHHESNLKSLLANKGQVSLIQREINSEHQKQIDLVEEHVTLLTIDAPLVTRSVKTRTAARVMIARYREAVELLAVNGHLDEKEEEKLMNSITDAEMKIAYHPNLEALPALTHVLEKIEFMYDLTGDERQRVIDAGAAYFQEYVGEVRLLEIGKRGARRNAKSKSRDFCGWFYVVRGNVERETLMEDGGLDCRTHSAGLLFGITDSMLNIPHHAGYLTHGFSDVVVFDMLKLLELAKEMPKLDKALWASVGAHVLRRSAVFHKYKLSSCHGLTDHATLLSGPGLHASADEKATVELAEGESLILVRGKLLNVDGELNDTPLGQPDTRMAPVLLEGNDRTKGCVTVTLSNDFKALKVPPNKISEFLRDEDDRVKKRETMRRRSMSLSSVTLGEAEEEAEDPRVTGMRNLLETGMSSKHPERVERVSALGVKAAMKLMATVKK